MPSKKKFLSITHKSALKSAIDNDGFVNIIVGSRDNYFERGKAWMNANLVIAMERHGLIKITAENPECTHRITAMGRIAYHNGWWLPETASAA